MWSYIYLLFFAFIIGTMFLHWIFYDLLIRIESERFQMDWIKEGRPLGMFYTPSNASIFKGSISRNRLMLKWVFIRPSWTKKDRRAEIIYNFFRLTGAIYFSTILLFIISFIVIFLLQP